jgi:hypothetical protein
MSARRHTCRVMFALWMAAPACVLFAPPPACGGGPGTGLTILVELPRRHPQRARLPRLLLRLRGGSGATRPPGARGVESARAGAGAAGLEDGGGGPRVFAAGGFVMGFGHSLVTDVVESYRPGMGGWRKEPALPVGTSGCSAETLAGSIYVMGGQDARFVGDDDASAATATDEHGEPKTLDTCVWPTLDTVFRLDVPRGQWLPAPPMLYRLRASDRA